MPHSFFMAGEYSIVRTYHTLSFARLGCFHLLATANSAALTIHAQACVFVSLGYTPRGGTAGSYMARGFKIINTLQRDILGRSWKYFWAGILGSPESLPSSRQAHRELPTQAQHTKSFLGY